jgi:hypothetical protein
MYYGKILDAVLLLAHEASSLGSPEASCSPLDLAARGSYDEDVRRSARTVEEQQ